MDAFKKFIKCINRIGKVAEQITTDNEFEEQEETCEHDWEVVNTCNWIYSELFHYNWRVYWKSTKRSYGNPVQKVCLKCGECVDEISEAINQIQERWDEKDRRKELAKKIWEDCKEK